MLLNAQNNTERRLKNTLKYKRLNLMHLIEYNVCKNAKNIIKTLEKMVQYRTF